MRDKDTIILEQLFEKFIFHHETHGFDLPKEVLLKNALTFFQNAPEDIKQAVRNFYKPEYTLEELLDRMTQYPQVYKPILEYVKKTLLKQRERFNER